MTTIVEDTSTPTNKICKLIIMSVIRTFKLEECKNSIMLKIKMIH